MTHLDDLGVSLFLDDEFALACGRHGGPGLVEDLLELLERAAASLDTEEEPEQRCAAIPHNEDKVVCAAKKISSVGDTQRRRGPQKYAHLYPQRSSPTALAKVLMKPAMFAKMT